MSARQPMWRRYQRLLGRDPVADLDDELQDHLRSAEDDLIASGLDPEAARVEARRRFGDVATVRRTVRELDARHERRAGIGEAVGSFAMDVRFATRMLRRSPLFTLVAVLSIAVGIAANATAFSLVNAVLFRPLPGTSAQGLVRVYTNHHSPLSWTMLDWFRSRAKSFTHVVGERYGAISFRAPGATEAQRVRSSLVSQGFFAAYQVPLALGRGFDATDRASESDAVAVLSHNFWRQSLGADSSVVGRQASIGGIPVTIVGVMGRDFISSVLGWTPQILLPVSLSPRLFNTPLDDMSGSFYSSAQLRDGVSMEAAASELAVLMSQLQQTDTARYAGTTIRLDHMRGLNAEVRGAMSAISAGLMLMVALVLMIACANVANLLLGRATARQHEIGVRLALGATRVRLMRQLLTESLLLALLGTIVGAALTFVITRSLAASIPAQAGLTSTFFAPDIRVWWFTLMLCLLTTVLFGWIPARRAAAPSVTPLLRAAGGGGGRSRRGLLIGVQAALAVVLLAMALHASRGFARMQQADRGFDAEHIMDVPIDATIAARDSAARGVLLERVLRETRTLSGIEAASLAAIVPMTGNNMETIVQPEGFDGPAGTLPSTRLNVISDGYFTTLRIPLISGREFLPSDAAASERVMIINETAAKQWWPGTSALGKRLRWGGNDGPLITVAGVAADITYDLPGESPQPFVYLPIAQRPADEVMLHIRSSAPLPYVRTGIWELLAREAPLLPTPSISRMPDDMAVSTMPIRVAATALAGLGVVALLLAACGIYALTAFAVAMRTRELGIRAALGASRSRLVRVVLGESLRPVLLGTLCGLALSSVMSFGISRVLFGIEPFDPAVILGISTLLALVAACASSVPAWRVTRIDPVAALRGEG